jgi:hypothetical protein
MNRTEQRRATRAVTCDGTRCDVVAPHYQLRQVGNLLYCHGCATWAERERQTADDERRATLVADINALVVGRRLPDGTCGPGCVCCAAGVPEGHQLRDGNRIFTHTGTPRPRRGEAS